MSRIDITQENSGYDRSVRAVATVTTDRGPQVFRGAWVEDAEETAAGNQSEEALRLLVTALVNEMLQRSDDQRRHEQEIRTQFEEKVTELQARIEQLNEEATSSGLNALLARLRVLQRENDLLQTEVTQKRATLARVNTAAAALAAALTPGAS